jgi:RNA recognition motif-containing protein
MENKNVFIGNLDFAVTEEEIKTLLSDYGTVVHIKMRKKKGCAFIEMSNAEEAALAIEKLNGATFKDREVRISLEIKKSKAKALSIKKYNERTESFSRQKKSENPDNRSAAQKPAGSPHPQRKEWSHDKPAHSSRPSRDGRKSGYGRSPKPETNYNSRKKYSGSDERPSGNYSRGRSDSPHPQRKEWSHDKPAHSSRPSGPSRPPGVRTRDVFKPRPAGGSPNRFSTSSRPKSGSIGKNSSANSARPKARGGEGNRDRNSRLKRD